MFLLQGLLISLVGLRWAKKGLEKEGIGRLFLLIANMVNTDQRNMRVVSVDGRLICVEDCNKTQVIDCFVNIAVQI